MSFHPLPYSPLLFYQSFSVRFIVLSKTQNAYSIHNYTPSYKGGIHCTHNCKATYFRYVLARILRTIFKYLSGIRDNGDYKRLYAVQVCNIL